MSLKPRAPLPPHVLNHRALDAERADQHPRVAHLSHLLAESLTTQPRGPRGCALRSDPPATHDYVRTAILVDMRHLLRSCRGRSGPEPRVPPPCRLHAAALRARGTRDAPAGVRFPRTVGAATERASVPQGVAQRHARCTAGRGGGAEPREDVSDAGRPRESEERTGNSRPTSQIAHPVGRVPLPPVINASRTAPGGNGSGCRLACI